VGLTEREREGSYRSRGGVGAIAGALLVVAHSRPPGWQRGLKGISPFHYQHSCGCGFFFLVGRTDNNNKKKKGSVGARESGSAVALFIYLFIYLLEEEVALFISGTRVGGWNVVPNPNAELHMDNCAIVC
jgi:hypothetical protein